MPSGQQVDGNDGHGLLWLSLLRIICAFCMFLVCLGTRWLAILVRPLPWIGSVSFGEKHRKARCDAMGKNNSRCCIRLSPLTAFWPLVRCFWLVVFCQCRLGEAANPGPVSKSCWTLGTFNPSGLAHRADLIAHLDGDFWGVTETHLSPLAKQKFVRGLRCQSSPFCNVVSGFDCPIRSRSEVAGSFTGVAALSRWPCRALPHQIPIELYQTSRIQTVGVCIHNLWINVGIMYGFPYSTTHLHPHFQTESLLSSLIDRIGQQCHGPRVIMGDFNWERHELGELDRLESLGFVELQQLGKLLWSQDILPTGKGTRRIDFVYISRELVGLLEAVHVDAEQWPDHSSVCGTFRDVQPALERFHWKMPQKMVWPNANWDIFEGPNPEVSATVSFADYWHKVEQVAVVASAGANRPCSSASLGRGQTLESLKIVGSHAPVRKGRSGELQPEFFGNSFVYAQKFKQLRRLQTLVRTLAKPTLPGGGQLQALWYKIRHAKGFSPGFGAWWMHADKPPDAPIHLTFHVPCHSEADIVFQVVSKHVKQFEKQLIKSRVNHAKQVRFSNLNYVFRDCAKAVPAPAELLVDSLSSQVIQINAEDSSVVIDPPVKRRTDIPICVKGQPLAPIHVEEDQLWVESLEPFEVGMELRQTKVHANVPAVLEAFRDEWYPKWNRLSAIPSGQWDQIAAFANRVLPRLQWTFRPWTLAVFDGAVRGKKAKAAVGPDGISRLDLMSVPSSVRQHLLQFYERIESVQEWPRQMTTGIVSSLEKQPGALSTKGFRPIVIYSVLTRIWSSVRARDFLQVFKAVAPDGLRGGIPARQSRSIWYELSLWLEQCHLTSNASIGIVVDLVKAFNMIPREVVWIALQAMNCPEWFVKSWASFVNGQVRRFKILSSVGAALPSDVGFPEGCALSVCAMGIIDLLLDQWLTPIDPCLRVFSYVDDWQLIHRDLGIHQTILGSLRAFVASLGMAIDESKSFVWATDCVNRQVLRQGSLPVALSAKELGAHLNFCWRKGNKSLIQRIDAMDYTWKMLRASLCPYRSKVFALKILAWPRSLYGISTVHIGKSHYEKLRSNAFRGLRQARVGSSPVLHLPLAGFTADPEGYAILQTFKDARELGDAEYQRSLLALHSTNSVRMPQNGPTSILISRMHRLGWQVTPSGLVRDRWNDFDLFTESIDGLKLRIAVSWSWLFTAEIHHRVDFEGLQCVDLAATAALVASFSSSDQVFLRCTLDGTFVTQKDAWKWDETKDGSCPFCHGVDGYYHRAWECPFFASARGHLTPEFWNWLSRMPRCVSEHAWMIRPVSFDHLAQCLLSLPEPDIRDARLSCCVGPVVDLFTDGTCSDPHNHILRLASWAITVAQPTLNFLANELVLCGHVVGLQQTAFRAELCAIVHALAIAEALDCQVRIWSDCQSALLVARRFQRGLARVRANGSHADLWTLVQDRLQRCGHRVVFMQVFSHNEVSSGMDAVEQWAYWHNGLTDAAAGKFLSKRSDDFWTTWRLAKQDWEQIHLFGGWVAAVHVDVGRLADASRKKSEVKSVAPPVVPPEPVIQQPKQYGLTKQLVAKHGDWILQQVHSWWQFTGKQFLSAHGQLRWISFIQLFTDFQLSTGLEGPTFLKTKWYPDSSVFPACDKPGWGAHSRWFQLLLKGYWKSNGLSIAVKSGPPHSSALSFWAVNAHIHWDETRLERIDAAILEAHGGCIRVGKDIKHLPHFLRCTDMAMLN